MGVYLWEDYNWKPWDNTVAYRPLTSQTTVNDQSWNNYTLTQTGGSFTTLWDVSCFYNGWGTSWYFNLNSAPKIPSGNADRTISLWVKPNSYSGSSQNTILSYGTDTAGEMVRFIISTSWKYGITVDGSSGIYSSGLISTSNWKLMTFVSSGNSYYLYVNWSLEGMGTYSSINTTAVSSSYPLRIMRRNTSTSSNYQLRWYLSEVIIEDIVRTDQKILNYFNSLKWKYWLS